MNRQPETILMAPAVTRLCEGMGLPDDVIPEVFLLESLRIQLWALSRGGQETANGRRITNRAERQLHIFGGQVCERAEGVRDYLRDLQVIGDAVHCGDDNWLPSPSRIVLAGSLRLFVGGVPTFLLPAALRAGIFHASPLRTIRDGVNAPPALPYQDLARWLGRPISSAEEQVHWMHDVRLSSISDSEGTWQVYTLQDWKHEAPWYSHGKRFEDIYNVADGRYIVWHRPANGGRPGYWIAQISHGAVQAVSHDRIDRTEVRQLLFSLDSVYRYPLRMRIWHAENGRSKLEQYCGLPRSEEQLLTATAKRENTPGKDFPIFWHFSESAVLSEVLAQLQQLGILIEHRHSANGDNR